MEDFKLIDPIKEYQERIGIAAIIEREKNKLWRSGGREGKKWLALSPRVLEADHDKKALKTKHPIAYWVNYGDDETFGLFSVEKITIWLNDPDLLLYKLGGTRECIRHPGR